MEAMKSEAQLRVEKLAKKLSIEGSVGHRWNNEGVCSCGTSELSVSDDGVCTVELEALLIHMAEGVMEILA